jgi:nitrite reductase/ring-hydroxylating ferredoxin subunit
MVLHRTGWFILPHPLSMAMPWHRAARVADVEPGAMARFEVDGGWYLIAHTQRDAWFAADLSCTHQYAELDSTGALVESQLTCFSHGATFDLAAGGTVVCPALSGGATPPLRTFPTRIEGEWVVVEIPEGDKPRPPAY